MGYSELKDNLQTHIKVHGVPSVQQDQEPDQASYIDKDYVSKVMASDEFRNEFDDFLASIRGE